MRVCAHAAWTLKAWLTPILQTLRVTMEIERWVYSPQCTWYSKCSHTHIHTLQPSADFSHAKTLQRLWAHKRLFPTSKGKKHTSAFSHLNTHIQTQRKHTHYIPHDLNQCKQCCSCCWALKKSNKTTRGDCAVQLKEQSSITPDVYMKYYWSMIMCD